MQRIEKYHHPRSIEEAIGILEKASGSAAAVAGGTEIVPHLPSNVKALVDISRLGLGVIDARADGVHIGACVTLQEIVDNLSIRNILDGVIREAAFQSATRFIRNAATIGGNLVSSNAAWDIVPALLAADASITLRGPNGARSLAIDEFLARREDHVVAGTILTEIVIPRLNQQTHARFEKLARNSHDAPIVTVVVRWTILNGTLQNIRVALGGIGDRAQRLRLIETALDGKSPSDDEIERATSLAAAQLHTVSDVRASAEYRAEMAAVLIHRALRSRETSK